MKVVNSTSVQLYHEVHEVEVAIGQQHSDYDQANDNGEERYTHNRLLFHIDVFFPLCFVSMRLSTF